MKESTRHQVDHLRKPRLLSQLHSLRTCVRNEVDLVPLACEDVGRLDQHTSTCQCQPDNGSKVDDC